MLHWLLALLLLNLPKDLPALISGRVLGEDGRAVPGAEVLLFDRRKAAVVSRVLTDESGRFTLRRPPSGRLDLLAVHPLHLRGHLTGIEGPAAGAILDLGAVTLPDRGVLEGRVTDTRGGPLEGARVELSQGLVDFLDVFPLGEDRGRPEAVLTGADGGFRAEGLRRGTLYDLTVTRAGYVEASALGVKASAPEPVRIEMTAARGLAGRVVDPQGKPVAGATLAWLREAPPGLGFDGLLHRELGRSGEDGRFRVTGLPPGEVELSVEAEGYQGRRVEGLRIPEDRDASGVEIVLERVSLLDVRVLSAEGEPVSGLWVRVASERPEGSETGGPPSGETDSAGRCRLSVPPGAYEVVAADEGRSVRKRVEAGPGAVPVELRLPPGVEVAGRVLEADGTGAAGVLIRIERAGARPLGAVTGLDSAFRLSSLPDGIYSIQAGGPPEEVSNPLEVMVAGRPVRDLELRLPPKGPRMRLTGHVLGLAPEEAAQASVSAFGTRFSRGGQVAYGGAYQIEDLAPGSWTIQAHLPSGRSAEAKVLRIEPGTPEVTLDLEFPAGFTVSGRALVDGVPLAGAELRLQLPVGTETRLDRTAYDGSFTFQDLPAGELILRISGPGEVRGSQDLQVTGNQEVTVDLLTGRLRGTVVSPAGEPVEGAEVASILGVLDPVITHTGPGGAFEIPRLTAGSYLILAEGKGFGSATASVEVLPGQEATVVLRLGPPAGG